MPARLPQNRRTHQFTRNRLRTASHLGEWRKIGFRASRPAVIAASKRLSAIVPAYRIRQQSARSYVTLFAASMW